MRFIVAVFLCFFLMLQPYAALGRLNREPDPSCSNTIEPAGKNLYVLSIGVDKYDTPQIKLQLANADARAFLEAITEHGRGLYRNIYSKLLTDPGVSDIESALESVIRTANPQDTFVLYYAGSGSEIVLSDGEPSSSDDSEAKRNRGIRHQPTEQEINSLDTILPTRTISNLNDKQNVLTNSITGRQLAAYCSRILANRQILILDSCYSSASIPNVQKLLLTKPDLDGVGRSIAVIGLSSSEDEDLALGHGQLTKAVLLGLSGQADSANTGEISISTLQAFVKKTAPTLGNANLTPITIATFLHGNDFIFAEHMQQKSAPHQLGTSVRSSANAKTRDLRFDNSGVVKAPLLNPTHCCKAIFFACDAYEDSALRPLSNPISDVEAIAAILDKSYGWNCEIHRNPTIADIRASLTKQSQSKYNPDCELMIYFAGHGTFVKDINLGFIAASDSPQTPNKDSWLSHSELVRYVIKSESPHTMLVIDACFGAALGRAFQNLIETDFKRSSNPDDLLQSVELQTDVYRDLNLREYYGQIFACRPTQWCVVSGTGAVPDGDEKKHSPFARKFLQTLTRGSEKGFLTRRDVEAALELVGSGPISSDIPGVTYGGPFIFLKK